MDYLNKELVSIIVPVYNSSAYIENCVSGLLCQSYKNIEIILVDEDEIVRILKEEKVCMKTALCLMNVIY